MPEQRLVKAQRLVEGGRVACFCTLANEHGQVEERRRDALRRGTTVQGLGARSMLAAASLFNRHGQVMGHHALHIGTKTMVLAHLQGALEILHRVVGRTGARETLAQS